MTQYALLIDGEFQGLRRHVDRPADIPHKKVVWLESSPTPAPPVDHETHKLQSSWSVEVGVWTEKWSTLSLSPAELEAVASAKAADADVTSNSRVGRMLFELFNKVRVLEAKSPLTAEQFKDKVRGL